jgi:rubrerythrin
MLTSLYMPKFTRKIEDFTCENCGQKVKGNGFTNHCPFCLFSKHVDINPGDRLGTCGGIMEPVSIEMDHGQYVIIHKCQKCGFMKKNKSSPDDDFEKIIQISKSTRI